MKPAQAQRSVKTQDMARENKKRIQELEEMVKKLDARLRQLEGDLKLR